jgi:hypothetical protein
MRKIRSSALYRHTGYCAALVFASAVVVSGPGCHQHYHYYNGDPCAPVSSTVRSSTAPCDPPAAVVEGGTTVSDSTVRSTTISGGKSKAPRVVTSEPGSSSRFSWRRSDPDNVATVVEGTVDDARVNK